MTINRDQFSFFYDAQIRRQLVQFMRIFSLLKIRMGPDENGTYTEQAVPIRYGDMSRVVAAILKQNSENTVVSTNVMAASINDLQPAPERRQFPYHVSQLNIDERKLENGEYTNEMGASYSIQRYMPVPYDLQVQLDIWTTNLNTKFQILEQILTIFNPSVQIQQHDNMLDWTVMMEVELTEVQWTSRSFPQGTDSDRDVATLKFKIPVWINPPAKISEKRVIEQIVANVFDVAEVVNNDKFVLDQYTNCFDKLDQMIVTPGNYKVSLGIDSLSNELLLLNENGQRDNLSWADLFKHYGEFNPTISSIILKTLDNIEDETGDIYGTVDYHPTEVDKLIFTVNQDTLPTTIDSGPVDKIIDPLKIYPGSGLPAAAAGQRYLLLNDIPENTGTNPWGSVAAHENDIIEYNGSFWVISFNSLSESPNVYVKSLSSQQHYKFTGDTWSYTILGEYQAGYWRILI